MNETMTWTLSGHTFWSERYASDANRKNSIHIGLPSGTTWWCPKRADRGIKPGTTFTSTDAPRNSPRAAGASGLRQGAGRSEEASGGFSVKGEIPKALPVCPADAPVKTFNVVAMDYPAMTFNAKAPEAIEVDFERKIQITNPDAKIYALEEDAAKVSGGSHPMPLTLRVNVGDCVKVKLKNKMKRARRRSRPSGWCSIRRSRWAPTSATTPAIRRSRPAANGPIRIMRIRSTARRLRWSGTGATS